MKKFITIAAFILSLLFAGESGYGQTSWKGTTNTNWNTGSNWTNGAPTSTSVVIIGDNNFTGANQPTVNVASSCASLTIGGTVASSLTLRRNLVVNGNMVVQNGSDVIHQGSTLTVQGNWINNGSYSTTSVSAQIVFGGIAQLIGGSSSTTFRKVHVSTGTTVTLGINTTVSGSGSYIYIYGTLNPGQSPTYKLTSTVSFRIYSGGKINVNASAFTDNYALSGTVNINAGSIVDYSSTTVNQTVSNAYSYSTLIISGTGTKSLAANLPSLNSSATTAGYISVASGTFDLSTFTANRGATTTGGELSVSNGATLKVGGTSNFPANYLARSLSLASTVDYYAGNQTITAATYGNLTLSSNSGAAVKTFPGSSFTVEGNFTTSLNGGSSLTGTTASNVIINGDVNIGTGTTFNGNSNSHTLRGNWVNNGTYTGSTSTVTFDAPSKNISGSGSQNFNNINIIRSGTTASGNINVSGNFAASGAGEFIHNTGGVLTMTGTSKTISGTDITLSDYTVSGTVTSTATMIVNNNISVSGTLTCSSGVVAMSGTTKTISGSGTKIFSTLQVTGSVSTAVNFSVSLLLDVSGSFTATAGTATFTSSSSLSGTANLFNTTINGTSLQLTASSVLGIAGAFTITAGTLNVTSSIPNTVNYNGTGAQSVTATSYHNLILSNGNTKTAAGAITVNGNFTLATSTTFAAGSFTHTVLRNWINNGTFNASTGTIQFTGANNATLTGATSFNNVTINKTTAATTFTLANDISSVIVNMTNGTMLTGLNKITITNTRNGNGIILGTITRNHSFTAGSTYAFESPFNTIFFSAASGVTSVTVNVKVGSVNDFPDNASLNREYTITVPAGTYTTTLRLHYEDAEVNGNNEAFLELWKNSGVSWTAAGKTGNSTSSNYVELASIVNLNARWTLLQLPGIVRWNGSVSSAWETAANWTTVSGGGSTPPASTDIVQIGTGAFTHHPIISSAVNVKGITFGSVQAANLSLTSGGSLTTSGNIGGTWSADAIHSINASSMNLTVNGSINLSNGVTNRCINLLIGSGNVVVTGSLIQSANAAITFSGSGHLKIGDSYNYTSGSFTPSTGTITYEGSIIQTIAPVAYHNLTINKSGGRASLSSSLGIGGNLNITSGVMDITNATLAVMADVNIGAGATLDCDMVSFTAGGNWTNAGSYLFSSGTVTLNGTGTQTVSAGAFNNLTINKLSGTVNLSGNNSISGNLVLQEGTVNLSAYTLSRSSSGGSFTMGAGATLQLGGANNFPGNFSTNVLAAGSTVLYNGTGVQTVKAATYGNLIFSNGGSNAKSSEGNIVVAGNISINSGASFASGSFSVTLLGNWVNSGTFTSSTGAVILNGSLKTITGNTSFHRLTVNGSYTVTGSDISCSGTLTVSATGTYIAGSGTATVSGDLINSGNLTSTGITNFTGNTLQTLRLINAIASTSTGVINFNGTIAPILNSTSSPQFVNLNINNTAGINPSVNWTVFGAMTVGASASFNGGISTHTMYGSFTNNGAVTSNGRLNFTPFTAKTIAMGSTGFTSTGIIDFGGSGEITLTGTPGSIKTLIISNTHAAGVTAPSGWTIDSNFVVSNSSKFNAGSYTFTVGGNIECKGILNGGTSNFICTGSAAELIVSAETLFHHLTISGNLTPQTDYRVGGNFTNNGTYDGSLGTLIMVGDGAGSIGGSTSPSPIAQLTIEKGNGVVVTQNVNVSDLLLLNIFSGVLFTSTRTTTQDASGGFLAINSDAILRVGGTNSIPAFAAYSLDPNSTVDYAGVGTTQLIANSADYGHVLVSGTGNKNAYAALNILGNLTVTDGVVNTSTFTVSHSIGGNFTMTGGTLSGTNSTYILNGELSQELKLLSALNRLRINKISGVVNLGSDVTVNLVTTFTSGKISTGIYKLIVPSTGSISGAGQSTGWVIGNLQKNVATGSAVSRTYELGGISNYSPATVLFATVSVAGNVTGKASDDDHTEASWSLIDVEKSVNRNWTFSNSGTGFTTANITFNWQASDLDAGTTPSNFKVGAYHGAAWSLVTTAAPTSTSIQATGLSSFKEYAVGENISVYKWTGGAMTSDWFTLKNWNGGVPNTSYNTLIPNGLFTGRVYPILTGTGVVKDITIENAASVVVSGGTLKVSGTIINNGVLNATQGAADFNGSTNQYITAGMFTGNKLMDLQISNDVFLQTVDTLTGVLNVATGKTFTTNDNLILRSDSLGTARVGALPVDGAGAATAFITGKLTIERYIPVRKAWRLLSAPVKAAGAPSINAAWQEGLTTSSPNPNMYPGYGLKIQGGRVAQGFDQGLTASPSIKIFDNNVGNFVALPATGTNTPITNYPGYFLFVRGDRSVNLMQGNSAAITATTLRIKGNINTGKLTTKVDSIGFTILGNPYPSPIDFATLTKNNVQNTFYVWDPKLAGAYGLGSYVTVSYNSSTGNYDVTTSASPISQYIPSGEAIIVQAEDTTASGTITIQESDKTDNGSDQVFGRGNGMMQKMRVNLYSMETASGRALLDGVLTTYDVNNKNALNAEDAAKLNGGSENIGIKRQRKMLSIERRQTILKSDTTFLNIYQMKIQNYQLEITADNMDTPNMIAVIKDNYNNTINNMPLNLNGTTLVDFSIDANPASYAVNRFSIVFAPAAAVLPVVFNTIKAKMIQKTVAIDWSVSNEVNAKSYEIERSADGAYFTKIGTKTITGTGSNFAAYRHIDSLPNKGDNFYRIKSIDFDGKTILSTVVKVSQEAMPLFSTVNLYPNPVTGPTSSLRMNNVPEGNYQVRIVAVNGQLMQTFSLYHDGTSSLQRINISKDLPGGKYELVISGSNFSHSIPLLKQ